MAEGLSVNISNNFDFDLKGQDLNGKTEVDYGVFGHSSLFWGGKDKLALVNRPVDSSYIDLLVDRLGLTRLSHVVVPVHCSAAIWADSVSRCLDSMAVSSCAVRFWGATRQALLFVDMLRSRGLEIESPDLPESFRFTQAMYPETKLGVRALFDTAKYENTVLLPNGYLADICSAVGIVLSMLRAGKQAVVKASLGLGGSGVVVVSRSWLMREPGALANWLSSELDACPYYVRGAGLVVEEYVEGIDVSGTYFVDSQITHHGSNIIGTGREIRDAHNRYRGSEISIDVATSQSANPIGSAVVAIGRYLEECGYRGFWSADFAIGKDKIPRVLEVNLRRFAETVAYDIVAQSSLVNNGRFLLSCSRAGVASYSKCADVVSAFASMETDLMAAGGDALPFNVGGLQERPPFIGYAIVSREQSSLVEIELIMARHLAKRGVRLERKCLS